jgi:NAD(P)H-hydrate epimerase
VVSVAEMRDADAAAPVPVDVLIGRAGWAVARAAIRMLGGAYGRRVVVVAGKGNNGADGRAAAALLERRGARTEVVDPGAAVGVADLVIDAAFGTGFRGSYAAPDPGPAPVLSVDIPSGVDGDTGTAEPTAVWATATVTMAAWKPGLLLGEGAARAGTVEVADIGLPVGRPRAHLIEDADLALLPPRPRDTHKWTRAVWIVAGSSGMRGAPALCSRAAQRAGAGMIHIGSPGVDASDHPADEAVAVSLPAAGWDDVVLGELDRFGALVVGPGLGRTDAAREGVRRLVARAHPPVVVDADGLFALGSADDAASVIRARPAGAGPVVLTPHDGEFRRLAGCPPGDDRLGAARTLAERTGAVVLLKGSTTVVAQPDGAVLLSATGDARLATAGTGDVLSGIIGAFLCRGMASGSAAAALAAHVHGRAAAAGHRVGLVAGDLPDLVPAVLES